MDWPELFNGAEEVYNLFFQLSIGYIINFMFYITQVYIPNNKKESAVRKAITERISSLMNDMDASLSKLAEVYVKDFNGKGYTDEDLKSLLALRFSDTVRVLDAAKTTRDHHVYFTVRCWIEKCIIETEKDIDNLYRYYPSDISTDLMKTLEAILKSQYHTIMKTLLAVPNDVNFSECKMNFFTEYYELIKKLGKIQIEDYFN